MGHHSELQLPDGDDLLGMTAHTPSGAPMVRLGTISITFCILCVNREASAFHGPKLDLRIHAVSLSLIWECHFKTQIALAD